jgi:hypothetical protein
METLPFILIMNFQLVLMVGHRRLVEESVLAVESQGAMESEVKPPRSIKVHFDFNKLTYCFH